MQCCIAGCCGDPGPGIQGFYNFPQDTFRKLEWLNAVGKLEEEISVLSALCSIHFAEDCFEYTSKGMLLKTDAIPVVNLMESRQGLSKATNNLKRSLIVVSTAKVRMEKKRKITESDVNQDGIESQMNIIEDILKEYNSRRLTKEHLYILKSKPEKIKDVLDAIRSNGYKIRLRNNDIKIPPSIVDDNDENNYSEVDIPDEADTDGITGVKVPAPYIETTNLQPESKHIIHSTLQAVVSNETSEEHYILVENTEEKEPEKKKKRRKKILKATKYAPVSDTIEIQILNLEQQKQRIKDALESSEFLRNAHRCYKCGVSFRMLYHYRQHMIRHDKSFGTFHCNVCDSYFVKSRRCTFHKRIKHQVLFRCKLCSLGIADRDDAKSHSCDGTIKTSKFTCEICSTVLGSQSSYNQHKHVLHKLAKYACSECATKFSNPRGLAVHQSRCKEKAVECTLCKRKFRNQHEVQLHQQFSGGDCIYSRRNRNIDPEIQRVCEKSEAETAEPDPGRFRCDKCNVDLLSRRSFLMHMTRTHPPEGVPIFRCHECNVTFATRYTYKIHMSSTKKHSKPDAYRFQCEYCSAAFTSKLALQQHLQKHSDKKIYRCSTCDETFLKSHNFWSHKRYAHSGRAVPKNYPCTYCDRRYRCNVELQNHIRSHTSEKPFDCDSCGKCFYSTALLKEHIRGVHLKITRNKSKKKDVDDTNINNKKKDLEDSSGTV